VSCNVYVGELKAINNSQLILGEGVKGKCFLFFPLYLSPMNLRLPIKLAVALSVERLHPKKSFTDEPI
jgi:hypothetical protein